MRKPVLTPRSLFEWADRYARRREARGDGTVYPTLRQAARRFRARLDEIEAAADEGVSDEDVYLGVAVAVGIQGVGCADLKRSERLVEAYR